jgi:hypothetical protein
MNTLRDLIEEAERLGYVPSPTANGHHAFRHSCGALVHVSGTPSDYRGLRNAKGDLRRELRIRGVNIEVEVRSLPPKERARKPRPTPALAGSFRPTGQHGRLAGEVEGKPAELVLRRGPEGQWLALRWADLRRELQVRGIEVEVRQATAPVKCNRPEGGYDLTSNSRLIVYACRHARR